MSGKRSLPTAYYHRRLILSLLKCVTHFSAPSILSNSICILSALMIIFYAYKLYSTGQAEDQHVPRSFLDFSCIISPGVGHIVEIQPLLQYDFTGCLH